MKVLCSFLLLFTIVTFGQRTTTVQAFLESKLSTYQQTERLKGCLEIIASQDLDTVLNQVPIGFPLPSQEKAFVITGVFGLRDHPIEHYIKIHRGIDIAAKVGTAIITTAHGRVKTIAKSTTGYGNMVVIEHNYGFESLYAHLSKILVKKGDRVTKGQIIGLMGATGKATGSHLHYEIRKNGRAINPKTNILLKNH
ncbi:MAG: M23 family metallopeptidase, partial [Bacteroidota bacterium]